MSWSSNKHPERITKKYLAMELGYYSKSANGEIRIDRRSMGRMVYTPELVEDVLGMTYKKFNRIKQFDKVQTRKILEFLNL